MSKAAGPWTAAAWSLLVSAELLLWWIPAHAGRWTLVIGNDNYEQISRLRNACANSKTMADALRAMGYHVEQKNDCNQREMLDGKGLSRPLNYQSTPQPESSSMAALIDER